MEDTKRDGSRAIESNPEFITTPEELSSNQPHHGTMNDNTPNDEINPLLWPISKKRPIIILITTSTFLASMAATIFAPGVPLLMKEMHSTNKELAAFVVSIYIIGFGLGPLVLAPLSELYGRCILMHFSNIGGVIFSVACALSPSLGSFVGFRLLMGIAGCIPVTIGGGVIADLVPLEKRGAAMSFWGMGPLLGPVIGPVIGGYLAQEAGWRWIFWLLAIAGGVLTIVSLVVLRETYRPVLQRRQARHSSKHTNEATTFPPPDLQTSSATQEFAKAIVRPTKMILFSPIASILALLISIYYSYLYFLFTTFTPVFEDEYGFSTGEAGLAFLGLGVGLVLGVVSVGLYAERITQRRVRNTGIPITPEDRLPPSVLGAFLFPAGLFWYGWAAHYKVHWMVPMIGTTFVGYGGTLVFLPVQMYLVDAFQLYAASAVATNTIARNIIGATLPLVGDKLYESLGLGWGNSLLAFICVAVIPVPILLLRYGKRLRTSERFQLKLD